MLEMENHFQTVDELIVAVMQMGFELDDCTLAIQQGKLTPNEIVEWITAGKPMVEPTGSVLRLNKVNQSVTQSPTNTDSQGPGASSANASVYGLERPPEEDSKPLVSRVNRNEEQRLFKLRFEEKQRQEAKKQAQLDKAAKKKSREDALRRIQEDRENVKARQGAAFETSTDTMTAVGAASVEQTRQSKTLRDTSSSVLQIRLMDGKSLKQSFSADTPLQEVREFIQKQSSNGEEISLMQPFPRVEYEDADMSYSLNDLGLVPSGSLVVKKRGPVNKQPSVDSDKRQAEGSDTAGLSEPSKKKKVPTATLR